MISIFRPHVIFLFFLLFSLLPRQAGAAVQWGALLQRADELYADGRYLESLSFYRDCANNTQNDKEIAAAFWGLGLLYDRYLGESEAALDYYNRHIRIRGDHSAQALHYSARILSVMNRGEEAAACYKKLARRYPAYVSDNLVDKDYDALHVGPVFRHSSRFDRAQLVKFSGSVRVLIENTSSPVEVMGDSGLFISHGAGAEERQYHESPLVVISDNGTMLLNGMSCRDSTVTVRGARRDRLCVNGRWYRSRLSIRAENGRLLVVNHVDLEQYLYGVLPREVYASWPKAVLQAQAVTARTYALYHMVVRQDCDYDVLSTTSSQAYGGLEREHPATNSAVDATRGVVLFNAGELVLGLYHANSGGVLEAVEDVWGARIPYLRRIVDTPSLSGRWTRWSCVVSEADMIERFRLYGIALEVLDSMNVLKRSGTGRVQQVELRSRGTAVLLSGNSLRLIVGPSTLKSTRFVVDHDDGTFRFRGTGYGHGVGMSQWGACALANGGADYRAILLFYYPGTGVFPWR